MRENVFAVRLVGERSCLCQETSRCSGRQGHVSTTGALCHLGPGKGVCVTGWLVRPVGVGQGSKATSSRPPFSLSALLFLF